MSCWTHVTVHPIQNVTLCKIITGNVNMCPICVLCQTISICWWMFKIVKLIGNLSIAWWLRSENWHDDLSCWGELVFRLLFLVLFMSAENKWRNPLDQKGGFKLSFLFAHYILHFYCNFLLGFWKIYLFIHYWQAHVQKGTSNFLEIPRQLFKGLWGNVNITNGEPKKVFKYYLKPIG